MQTIFVSQRMSYIYNVGNWDGRGVYYKGRITKINPDGTYNIAYDDGDKEENIERKSIKYLKLVEGEKVLANFHGKNVWYPGVIGKSKGAVYDVTFDDGDHEELMTPINVCKDIRELEKDDDILGNWSSEGAYFKGKITKIESHGKYSILYDDGDTETGVQRKYIKSNNYHSLQVGQRVLGNFNNKGVYYPGKVKSIIAVRSKDPTEKEFLIAYDDGDKEKVTFDRVVPLEDGTLLPTGQKIFGKLLYIQSFCYLHDLP